MKTKKAILVLNGKDFCVLEFQIALDKGPEILIAVDGGIHHLENLPVPPLIHIGDMDSSVPDSKVPVKDTVVFPADKDSSDFFLALDFLHKKGVDEVVVFAATGGRSDHFISNYETAVDFASGGMKIVFSGQDEDIFFLPCNSPDGYEFDFPEGSTVSVFAGTDECEGVSLEGFKYPVRNEDLHRNFPRGLSNVVICKKQKIDFEKGVIVVIFSRKI